MKDRERGEQGEKGGVKRGNLKGGRGVSKLSFVLILCRRQESD